MHHVWSQPSLVLSTLTRPNTGSATVSIWNVPKAHGLKACSPEQHDEETAEMSKAGDYREVYSQQEHVLEEDCETSISSSPFSTLFPSHHKVGSFAPPHMPHHNTLLYHRPKSSRANQPWTEPSKAVSQNISFLFLNWLSQVFCGNPEGAQMIFCEF